MDVASQGRPHQQHPSAIGGLIRSLRIIELQIVVFIMAFSACGLVPLFDISFPVFVSAYLFILSRFAFPSPKRSPKKPMQIFQGSKLFRIYIIVGTVIGLFFPLAYVLGGFARGDDHAAQTTAPHLFLLSFQILTENILSWWSLFSAPVRALVPLIYTARRIFVIVEWMRVVWVDKRLPTNANLQVVLRLKALFFTPLIFEMAFVQDVAWFWFGRVLSCLNFVYFFVNLFGFLIPTFLPRAFEAYLGEKGENASKVPRGSEKSE